MRIGSVVFVLLLAVRSSAVGQAPCQLRGVWELVSARYDDKLTPTTWHQIKIYTERHFAFLGAEDRGVNDMKTAADSLDVFRRMSAGGGTYTVQGDTFTETATYFENPAYRGRSFTFTCQIAADRFTQTGLYPVMKDGKKVRDVKLEEVYRRIE